MLNASDFSNFYKLPLGRCVFGLRTVERRARALGQAEIAELAARGAETAEQAMDMVMRLQAGRGGQYVPEASVMDAVVDRYLGGVFGHFEVQMRMYEGKPRGHAAMRLSTALFPQGVGAITHLPYPEEHEQVNALLERARSAELADDVRAVPELAELLELLRDANREYGELLRQEHDLPTHEEIRTAHERALEYVVVTADLIFGLYALRAPDKIEERDHLLEPLVQQNEAVAAIRRRRRVPSDVDPDTGAELPGGGSEPGSEPGGEPGGEPSGGAAD